MRGISHSGCSMGWAKIEGLITATSATTCTPALGSVTGTLAVANKSQQRRLAPCRVQPHFLADNLLDPDAAQGLDAVSYQMQELLSL
jgi:hypothetical protein